MDAWVLGTSGSAFKVWGPQPELVVKEAKALVEPGSQTGRTRR